MLDPPPVEVEMLLARRRELGLDLYDEIWEGVYHMAPMARGVHGYLQDQLSGLLRPYAPAKGLVGTGPFNLGDADDFRVPDHGYHRHLDPEAVYLPTAAVVVEIVSPGDETYDKMGFYAAHAVDELLVVEPERQAVLVFALTRDNDEEARYEEALGSSVLGVGAAELTAAVRWL